jgi:predicted translin family RNA/ssDNA-binding protein
MPKLPKIPYKLHDQINRERSYCMNLSDKLRVLSKTTISFLVKDNFELAEKNLPEMNKLFLSIQKKMKQNPYLYGFPVINIGLEEYLETLFLYAYIKNKPMPNITTLRVTPEVYLGGLSDMTGELVRLARRHENQVRYIHDYVARIYELIIPLSITRNSQTRNKLETIGNNLRKIEGIIYDLKLRDKI